jgi:hypothetical protein
MENIMGTEGIFEQAILRAASLKKKGKRAKGP